MSFDCILQFLPTYLFTPLSGRAKVTNILSFLYASKWQQQFQTWTTTIHIVSELGHLLFWSHFLPLPHSIRQQSNFDKWCLHSQSRIVGHHHFSGQRHHNLCHRGQNHSPWHNYKPPRACAFLSMLTRAFSAVMMSRPADLPVLLQSFPSLTCTIWHRRLMDCLVSSDTPGGNTLCSLYCLMMK